MRTSKQDLLQRVLRVAEMAEATAAAAAEAGARKGRELPFLPCQDEAESERIVRASDRLSATTLQATHASRIPLTQILVWSDTEQLDGNLAAVAGWAAETATAARRLAIDLGTKATP